MATRFYLHDATWTPGSGDTAPVPLLTGRPVNSAALVTQAPGLSTLRKMDTSIGTGPQIDAAATTQASTTRQTTVYRVFVSPPLQGGFSVPSAASVNYRWNVADSQTNSAAAHIVNCAHVYVYRPSTGAIVGTIGLYTYDGGPSAPSTTKSPQVSISQNWGYRSADSSPIAVQDYDVIVVQIAANFTQSMATAYSGSFYYDGNTVNTTENAVVTSHASYLDFDANFSFLTAPLSIAASSACVASASANLTSAPAGSNIAASAAVSATATASLTSVFIGAPCISTAYADLWVGNRIRVTRSRTVSSGIPGQVGGPLCTDGSTWIALRPTGGTTEMGVEYSTDGGAAWTAFGASSYYAWRRAAVNSAGVAVLIGSDTDSRRARMANLTTAPVVSSMPAGWFAQELAAVGTQFAVYSTDGSSGRVEIGTDGSSWTISPTLVAGASSLVSGRSIGICSGRVVYSGPTNRLQSWASGESSWTLATIPASVSGDQCWLGPVTLGGTHYVVGNVDGTVLKSTDANTWTVVGRLPVSISASFENRWSGLLTTGPYLVVAVNADSSFWVSRDGADWEKKGDTFSDGTVLAAAPSSSLKQLTSGAMDTFVLAANTVANTLFAHATASANIPAVDLIVDKLPLALCSATATATLSVISSWLSSSAVSRSRCPTEPITQLPLANYTLGQGRQAYDPVSGIFITPTMRRIAGTWSDLPPPDGVNTPDLVASDGAGRVAVFNSVGPSVYTSTNAVSWSSTSTIPAPPGGWGAVLETQFVGGAGGAFLIAARTSATQWYVWKLTGSSWSSPVALTPLIGTGLGLKWVTSRHGFAAVQPLSPSGLYGYNLHSSVDGASWAVTRVGGDLGTAYGGSSVTTSGRYLYVCATGDYGSFIDLATALSGREVVPRFYYVTAGSYTIGDPWASQCVLHFATTSQLVRVKYDEGFYNQLGSQSVPPPAGFEMTGDYVVFDDVYFGQISRVADSVRFGAETSVGPRLYSSSVAMVGAAQSVTSLTAGFATTHALGGAMTSIAAASATTLTTRQAIAASAAAQASVSAVLQVPQTFIGSAAGQAQATAALTTAIRMSASPSAASTSSATATTGIVLLALASVESTAAALTIQVPKPLIGAGQAVTTTAAALSAFRPVAASVLAQATPSAALTTQVRLSGALTAATVLSGDILVSANFRASGAGQTTTSADLTTGIALGASLQSASTATAALMLRVLLDSALTVESAAEGDLDTSVKLQAHVQGVVAANAALRRTIPLDARKLPLTFTEQQSGIFSPQFEASMTHLAQDAVSVCVALGAQAYHTTSVAPITHLTTDEN